MCWSHVCLHGNPKRIYQEGIKINNNANIIPDNLTRLSNKKYKTLFYLNQFESATFQRNP